MQTASTALPLFVVGRVFAGLGVGLVSTLVPMYQSECAPKWIRGAIVAGYQWAITIGLLLASVVNNATQNRPNHSSYRIPIAIQFIWAAVLAAGMLVLPEVRSITCMFAFQGAKSRHIVPAFPCQEAPE
jgi:MFS transporter, SP family, sugar:H+ symporter